MMRHRCSLLNHIIIIIIIIISIIIIVVIIIIIRPFDCPNLFHSSCIDCLSIPGSIKLPISSLHLVSCLPCLLFTILGLSFCYSNNPFYNLFVTWHVLSTSTVFSFNSAQDAFNLCLFPYSWCSLMPLRLGIKCKYHTKPKIELSYCL